MYRIMLVESKNSYGRKVVTLSPTFFIRLVQHDVLHFCYEIVNLLSKA